MIIQDYEIKNYPALGVLIEVYSNIGKIYIPKNEFLSYMKYDSDFLLYTSSDLIINDLNKYFNQ